MRDFFRFLRGDAGTVRLDAGFFAGLAAAMAILLGLALGSLPAVGG